MACLLRHGLVCDKSGRSMKGLFYCGRRYMTFITDDLDGKLITPKEIKKYLDKYVIGQESAKIALATGTYQHYKRTMQHTLQPPKAKNMKIFASPSSRKHALHHVKNHPDLQGSFNVEKDVDDSNTVPEQSNFEKSTIKLKKSNILMIGPTGSGKTYLISTLAKYLNVPFLEFDCTTLTATGYEGENVETIFVRLLQAANNNIRRCQHGIVYLDEVDKLARSRMIQGKDVGGEAVQQGLLKVLEGTVVEVQDQFVKFIQKSIDTTNILFIASGAFSGLHKVVDKRKKKHVGFGAPVLKQDVISQLEKKDIFSLSHDEDIKSRPHERKLKDISEADIINFGFLPEFVGRMPRIVLTDPLNEDDLIRILTEPKNALVKQYKHLFGMNNCDLKFTEGALKAIARMACKKGTGARGLKAELDKLLHPALYDVPGSDIMCVMINEDCVLNKMPAVYRRELHDNQKLKIAKLNN